MAIETIINQALDAVGYAHHINDIFEGSPAARVALEFYGQTRDELLRVKDWSFSRKVQALTLLKGPPPVGGFNFMTPWTNIYPYSGFLYEYGYPRDCLDLRAIIAPPDGMPDLDPLPAQWRVDNDPVPIVSGTPPVASGPPQKVILCNTTNAMAVYRAQITDPDLWETGFTQTLIAELAKKFAPALQIDIRREALRGQDANATVQVAQSVRG